MRTSSFRFTVGIAVLFWGSVGLEAYDSHHPDPMSILNGSYFKKRKRKPIEKPKEVRSGGPQPWRMYKGRKEGKYILKPEPYSIATQKADPELLGPQRTYTASAASAVPTKTPAEPTDESNLTTPPKRDHAAITRAECIALIGEEKFDRYVAKFGTEAGALRRCLIFKRNR
jgi:hypothetical protein